MHLANDPGQEGTVEASTATSFQGSCHCRAVNFTVKFPSPLSQLKVVSCNCSYCCIASSLLAFVDDIEIQGTESLTEYRFGSHTIQIFFCKTCGANVSNKSLNPKFKYGERNVNMRLLHGIDLEALQVTKLDGKNFQLLPPE